MLNLQAAGEVKALEDFYKMLQHEPDRALYGWGMKATASQANRPGFLMLDNQQPLYFTGYLMWRKLLMLSLLTLCW